MGGYTQSKILRERGLEYAPEQESTTPRVTSTESAVDYIKIQRAEKQRAEEVERNRLSQQLEEVRQQREATQAQAEQTRLENEAKANSLENQQRALEQTGVVDTGGGGTAKPYNPTSSSSTTVEGLGGERDTRRKRNQLTAYLGI